MSLSPWSMITAYPPQEIESYVDKYKYVNVYVDLKNIMSSLFVTDISLEIVNYTDHYKVINSVIFQSVVAYCSYWMRFCIQRGIKCKIYVSTDVGRSTYHLSIDDMYKYRRTIKSYYGIPTDDDNKMKVIRDKNFEICNNIVNRIPDVYFFNLHHLESDFLCHYLITRKFNNPNILHIIASSDKDMYQTVVDDNVIMINKKRKVKCLYDKHSVMRAYMNVNKASENSKQKTLKRLSRFNSKFIPALMAIIGDEGDDVTGVDGIGPNYALEIFDDYKMLEKVVGTPDDLNERVRNGGKFFIEDIVPLRDMSKRLQKCVIKNDVVTKAFKLISYEQLIYWLEKPDMTEKVDWLRYIDSVLNKDKWKLIPTTESFMMGMTKLSDCSLTENDLDPLFIKHDSLYN